MTEAAQTTKPALSVKDAQELLALQTSLLQPAAEKAAAYGRHVYEIAASTGAEVSRVAEAQAAEAQAKFMAIVDTAVKNAPAGTENAVALVKSAVAAANNAIETRAEGHQASRRSRRSELQRDVVDRRPRHEGRQEGLSLPRRTSVAASDAESTAALRRSAKPGAIRAFFSALAALSIRRCAKRPGRQCRASARPCAAG